MGCLKIIQNKLMVTQLKYTIVYLRLQFDIIFYIF